VPFSRELSVLAVRDSHGNVATYPLAQNEHLSGILYRTELPAPNMSPDLAEQAETIASRILEKLNYIGVLAVELFEVNGTLIANEIAPRVHNSGHATIDGSFTSQFENHIRAITGMPLGSTASRSRAVMYNLVGSLPHIPALKALPNAKVHLYGKSPREGRKLGHITVLDPSPQTEETLQSLIARAM
jgi:5-(carboxyamino)imidazole ribonucleotide synthase